MNRSFQAFAVLLVSLAGAMLAAMWTSMPQGRVAPVVTMVSDSVQVHCSCNPDSLARYEEGCARNKTTGEFYGCGLGTNATAGKSIISRTFDTLIANAVALVRDLRQAAQPRILEGFAIGMKQWTLNLADLQDQLANDPPQDPSIERDYAAAEQAAAGFDPGRRSPKWPNVREAMTSLASPISSNNVRTFLDVTWCQLSRANHLLERQMRRWLVETGLHRQWDAMEEVAAAEAKILASSRIQFPHEDFDRWFENFPPSVTSPDVLLNPGEKGDERDQESRRIILATANVLETLSAMLHQTAENLARHAEQDVAKLHTLKSNLEGRR